MAERAGTAVAGRSSPPRRPAFRLHGPARRAALILHVLTSVGWFGIAVAVVACVVAANFAAQPSFAHALYRVLAASTWVSVPFGLTSLATGVLVALGSRYGLLRHWWVVVKTILNIAVVVTDAYLVSALAQHAAATGQAPDPLYGSTSGHVVVLVIATALSVIKPRGVTPWGRRALASGNTRRGGQPSPEKIVSLLNSFGKR